MCGKKAAGAMARAAGISRNGRLRRGAACRLLSLPRSPRPKEPPEMTDFRKILIANRGELAIRVMRAANERG
ncbi:MAG: hypothetical protein KDK29_20580, partial [Sedimentitalea sp.]|nr:hypothetical protein [Sedimentitalea sp.]